MSIVGQIFFTGIIIAFSAVTLGYFFEETLEKRVSDQLAYVINFTLVIILVLGLLCIPASGLVFIWE